MSSTTNRLFNKTSQEVVLRSPGRDEMFIALGVPALFPAP
jgi:hypothetical protein